MMTLHVVTALMPEARPLVKHFALKGQDGGPFRRFSGDGVELVVSGIGKVAAAAATAHLAAEAGSEPGTIWLNVGVVGHCSRPVGQALLAGRVLDVGSGEGFYPPLLFEPPVPVDTVRTVDRPELDFPDDHAYDMEASGFVATALRFASAEVVHCLKVVSDGPGDGARLRRQEIEALVASLLPTVDTLLTALEPLAQELAEVAADPPDLADLKERFRFTVSESRQLRRLLLRRVALDPQLPLPVGGLVEGRRGSDLLRRLGSLLDDLAVQGPETTPP